LQVEVLVLQASCGEVDRHDRAGTGLRIRAGPEYRDRISCHDDPDGLRGGGTRGGTRGNLAAPAEGRSNSAISDRLTVSPKTVESHIASIFSKLGLHGAEDDHRRVLAVLAASARPTLIDAPTSPAASHGSRRRPGPTQGLSELPVLRRRSDQPDNPS
jgi:hypothetical protein